MDFVIPVVNVKVKDALITAAIAVVAIAAVKAFAPASLSKYV